MNEIILAQEIIDKLCERKGFDAWWNDVPEETKKEIIDEIASMVDDGQYW